MLIPKKLQAEVLTGLSDPGYEVIQLALQKALKYTVLPGSNALVPALVASNLVSKEFQFLGFLPLKKGRESVWKLIQVAQLPVILYESVHRMDKLIQEMQKNLNPERKVSILKDLSKLHEDIWHGKVSELEKYNFQNKGEFAVVIDKAGSKS